MGKGTRVHLGRRLLLLLVAVFTAAPVLAFQRDVDDIWNMTKPAPRCKDFLVKAGPPKIFRGMISGRVTLEHAITRYRAGDHEEAFGWILAGACPNTHRQETLVRNAPKVLEYLLGKYGPMVK